MMWRAYVRSALRGVLDQLREPCGEAGGACRAWRAVTAYAGRTGPLGATPDDLLKVWSTTRAAADMAHQDGEILFCHVTGSDGACRMSQRTRLSRRRHQRGLVSG